MHITQCDRRSASASSTRHHHFIAPFEFGLSNKSGIAKRSRQAHKSSISTLHFQLVKIETTIWKCVVYEFGMCTINWNRTFAFALAVLKYIHTSIGWTDKECANKHNFIANNFFVNFILLDNFHKRSQPNGIKFELRSSRCKYCTLLAVSCFGQKVQS